MVLEAGVGREGRKAQVVINKQAQRQDVGVVALALTDVGIQLLVTTGQTGVVDNVGVEGVPNVTRVDGAVHGTALTALLVLDHGLNVEAIRFEGRRPAQRPLFVLDLILARVDIFGKAVFLRVVTG